MELQVKIDNLFGSKLLKAVTGELEQKTHKSLSKAAQYGIQIIQDRTEKGVGYKGKFKRYSAQYGAAKKKGWKKTKTRPGFSGDPSGIVNLNVTGKMTSSMTHISRKDKARIFFTRKNEAEKAAWNNKIRPFFGLNDGEMDRVRRMFIQEFKK